MKWRCCAMLLTGLTLLAVMQSSCGRKEEKVEARQEEKFETYHRLGAKIPVSTIPTNGLMPMAGTSLESCFKGLVGLVAVCEATQEAEVREEYQGIGVSEQKFKLIEVYYGDFLPGQQPGLQCSIRYDFVWPLLWQGEGRVIRDGERVIWILLGYPGNYLAKALPDTTENRAAVQEFVRSIPLTDKAWLLHRRVEGQLIAQLGKVAPPFWQVCPWEGQTRCGPGNTELLGGMYIQLRCVREDKNRGWVWGGTVHLWFSYPGSTLELNKPDFQWLRSEMEQNMANYAEFRSKTAVLREFGSWRDCRVFVYAAAPDWPDWETQIRHALKLTDGDGYLPSAAKPVPK